MSSSISSLGIGKTPPYLSLRVIRTKVNIKLYPDMNDPSNLALYGELMVFKSDMSKIEFIRNHPDRSLQKNLQAVAHYLGLEYEYSLGTRSARISRPVFSPEDHHNSLLQSGSPGADNSSKLSFGNDVPTASTGLSTADLRGSVLQNVGMSMDHSKPYR